MLLGSNFYAERYLEYQQLAIGSTMGAHCGRPYDWMKGPSRMHRNSSRSIDMRVLREIATFYDEEKVAFRMIRMHYSDGYVYSSEGRVYDLAGRRQSKDNSTQKTVLTLQDLSALESWLTTSCTVQ